jgi:hypothetical protein
MWFWIQFKIWFGNVQTFWFELKNPWINSENNFCSSFFLFSHLGLKSISRPSPSWSDPFPFIPVVSPNSFGPPGHPSLAPADHRCLLPSAELRCCHHPAYHREESNHSRRLPSTETVLPHRLLSPRFNSEINDIKIHHRRRPSPSWRLASPSTL